MGDLKYTLLGVLCGAVLPITLLTWFICAPSVRKRLAVVLGAVTPAVLFYVFIVVSYIAVPQNQGNRFSFYAGWAMTYPLVPILALAGLGASSLNRPENLLGRYAVGWAATGGYFLVAYLIGRFRGW